LCCNTDGLVYVDNELAGLVELKSPFYVLPKEGKYKNEYQERYGRFNHSIPVSYQAQCLYQMWSTGASFVDFLCCLWGSRDFERDLTQDTPEYFFKRIYWSNDYWRYFYPRLRRFSDCLRYRTRPTFTREKFPPPPVKIVDFPDLLEMQHGTTMAIRAADKHAARRGRMFTPIDVFNSPMNTYAFQSARMKCR
jgi:hypothetical protein